MGKGIIKIIKLVINQLLDIIYPPDDKCISCLEGDNIGICNRCKGKIQRVKCNGEIKSYAFYGKTIRSLILSFKYEKNFLAGRILGEYLCELINENNIKADLVMYVPLSKKSFKKRGFNQCEFMGKIIAERYNMKCYNGIIKIKDTKEQKTLSKEERSENVKGVFSVKDEKYLIGKSIILIDDVVTTGYTVKECKSMLEKIEGCTINVLTVAKSEI
ncbi:ComF family protein [Clostridium sp.]|uniref:ComF family protein n=1 Tax=Clostridium sp. TaxID=1506 RepID=UPI003F3ED8FC